MSEICPHCGGFTSKTVITRRLPATNSEGVPYPIADVPPVRLCDCPPKQQNPAEGITSVSHSDWDGAYVIREEIGYRPEEAPANRMRIELSPDLNREALMQHISDAMEKAGAQLLESSWKRLEADMRGEPEAEDSGHICQDGHSIPSRNEVREFVREEVARQLRDSSGIVDAREYIRVAGKTHDGRSVRGMLYFEGESEL